MFNHTLASSPPFEEQKMVNKYDESYFQHHSVVLAQEKHWLSNALTQGLLTVSEAKLQRKTFSYVPGP